MDDPARLRALIDAATRHEYDEAFERLARGELAESEAEELRTSADPEIRQLFELFRPLGPAAKGRFDAAVEQTLSGARQAAARPGLGSQSGAQQLWRRVRRMAKVVLPLAAAAAVCIYLLSSPPAPEVVAITSLARFPARSEDGATLLGDSEPSKPGNPKVLELLAGTCWNLKLSVPSTGKLPRSLNTYFVKDSDAVAWPVKWEGWKTDQLVPTGGCARLPELAVGTWELLVVSDQKAVNRTPKEAAALCRQHPPAGASFRCDRKPIRIVPLSPSSP